MKKSKEKPTSDLNNQQNDLYLLKTGVVISADQCLLRGVYNDGMEWTFKHPEELSIYPNSKVRLYRYHIDTHPKVSNMLVIMDPQMTYQFVIGSSNNGDELLQYGISRTDEENYFKAER